MEWLPDRRRVAVADGVELSVVDQAPARAAECLVFIHGAAGHLVHWQHMIKHFSPTYRTVAMDLRGHGESDKPESTYALEELVADVERLVEQLALPERFVLVAHCFGAALALTYAARHSERLRKMVLISTSSLIPLTPVWRPLLTLPTVLVEPVRRMVAKRVCCPTHVLKQFLPRTVYPWNGWNLLEQIKTPTLVLIAENDKIIPPAYTRRMAEHIVGSRVEVIRHSWHLPILERPDAVNRAMERFLTDQVKSWRGTVETPAE
ncbi:MAG TPA: alpha/beta hydrolase [Candidatus Xenobia bacterium]|jgi:pimeloyl-ACP methyl ester carboxylesterase